MSEKDVLSKKRKSESIEPPSDKAIPVTKKMHWKQHRKYDEYPWPENESEARRNLNDPLLRDSLNDAYVFAIHLALAKLSMKELRDWGCKNKQAISILSFKKCSDFDEKLADQYIQQPIESTTTNTGSAKCKLCSSPKHNTNNCPKQQSIANRIRCDNCQQQHMTENCPLPKKKQGKIKTIKKFGFIEMDNGQEFYFQFQDVDAAEHLIVPNANVQFTSASNREGKPCAKNIKIQ
jgi:cold shock CspA family protein